MPNLTSLNNYDLLKLIGNKTIKPTDIPKGRWTLDLAKDFIRTLYFEKIPKAIFDESDQIELYHYNSRAFTQIEDVCYAVCLLAVKDNPTRLSQVPKKHRTKELCELSVNLAFANWQTSQTKRDHHRWKILLGSIPKPLRTQELCLKTIQLDGKNLRYVPELTDDLILKAIEATPMALKHVPEEKMTADLIEKATERSGRVLKFIPKKFQTTDILAKTIRKSPFSIEWVENPSEEICLVAVDKNPEAIEKIKNPSEAVILKAIEKDGYLLLNFPKLQTNHRVRECGKREFERNPYRFERFRRGISKTNRSVLEDLNLLSIFNANCFSTKINSFQTVEQLILIQNACGEQHDCNAKEQENLIHQILNKQPWDNQEIERWIKALSVNRTSSFIQGITYQPKKKQMEQLEKDGLLLQHIQDSDQTSTLVQVALNQNPMALQFVSGRFKNSRLCRSVVANCPKAKYYSPYHIGLN